MLLPKVLLGLLLSIKISNCHKMCQNCVKVTECAMALDRVLHHKTPATAKQLQKAYCGRQNGIVKVCCSEFMINMRTLENDPDDDFEVEKHPNIDLLRNECGDKEGSKIVGGTKASLYEFPWLAIIMHKKSGYFGMDCGGSLINSRYVLTAAHCLKDREVAKVRIGEYNLDTEYDCAGEDIYTECSPKYQEIEVEEQIHHEAYSTDPVIMNDIGLLRLKEHVNLTVRNAGLLCLPITTSLVTTDLYGERGTVAGWGITENRTKSNVLRKVDVPIYSPRTCLMHNNKAGSITREAYNRLTNTYCASELGHDSCHGDSGGPLMLESYIMDTYKLVQYGIVSHGLGDCGNGAPSLYTDVRKYMKWILDHINP